MRRVRKKSVYLLWELNRFDGPLAGICLYRRQPYFFECYETDGIDSGIYEPRVYWLHRLSEEEFEKEKLRHQEFQKYVSEGTAYVNGTFQRAEQNLRPESEWHNYYDKYPPECNIGAPANLYFFEYDNLRSVKRRQRQDTMAYARWRKKEKELEKPCHTDVGKGRIPKTLRTVANEKAAEPS